MQKHSTWSNQIHHRQGILDFLRGIAILGMLVANIPWHVGNSMSRVIDPDASSVAAWLLQYLLFDQRFMPIFAFLFGAGFWIQFQRAESFQLFYPSYLRRMLVLFLLGVAHAYILWPGDILITYGVCGCLLLLFVRCNVWQLVVWGCLFKMVNLVFGEWPEIYDATLHAWLFAWWFSAGDAPMTIVQAYEGSYSDLFSYNAWRNQFLQWTGLPYFRIWNALGLMLLGIALYRTGVLQGEKSRGFYLRLFWLSLLLSIPLIVYGVMARVGINETVGPWLGFTENLPLRNITYRLGCFLGSFSVIALLHLFWNRSNQTNNFLEKTKNCIQNIGRMAFSNYIFQSLIFVLLFHSVKVLTFDSLDHDTMLLMVVLVWLIHLIFSQFWLSHFKQGPMESIYRYLSRR